MKKLKDRYYKIDERHTPYGTFELCENELYGNSKPYMVTLGLWPIGYTYDTLDNFIENFLSKIS